jgi:hypothetical protein
MAVNTNNRGNKRKKCVTIVLSEEEWQNMADYGKRYGLAPTAAGRRLLNQALIYFQ